MSKKPLISFPLRALLSFVNLPAKIKGVKFGKNSFFAPGYDFLRSQMKNIILDDDVLIDKHAWLQTLGNGKIYIGKDTKIGRNFYASASSFIEIGKGCLFSYNISIHDQSHICNKEISPNRLSMTAGHPLKIGNNCFIGEKAVFLEGSGVGDNCIVGASSVVTKIFPNNCIIAGVPAKIIRKI